MDTRWRHFISLECLYTGANESFTFLAENSQFLPKIANFYHKKSILAKNSQIWQKVANLTENCQTKIVNFFLKMLSFGFE